jgi:hypothetical protein
LIIPQWHAAIPADWPMEVAADADTAFASCAGMEIVFLQGMRIRGGPDTVIEGMLQQGFIREVTEA